MGVDMNMFTEQAEPLTTEALHDRHEQLGKDARSALQTLVGAPLYALDNLMWKMGSKRMGAMLGLFAGFTMLLSACAPKGKDAPTAMPTRPTSTLVAPPSATATEMSTFTATSTEMPSPTPGGPVGFEVTSTPSEAETLTPNPPTSTPEASTEVIRPPTVQEMQKLNAGGAIPDYAQPYYDAMNAEIPRIAKQLKVKASDVSVYYVDNGLAQGAYRWAVWVSVAGKGVAWPVDVTSGDLSRYPASFQLADPLKPEGAVKFDEQTYNWALVGSPGDEMGFAGTQPMIMDGSGTATVDGKSVDTYGQYLLPGGVSPTLAAQLDSAVWQRLDAITEIKSYPICKIEQFKNCVIPFDDLLNGNYLRWLQTLSKPFDPATTKVVPFAEDTFSNGVLEMKSIIFDPTTAPNFSNSSTTPFRRDVTFGEVEYELNGVKSFGVIKPIEFYDPHDPTNNKWVIAVDSYYTADHPDGAPYLNTDISTWKNSMRITPILEGTTASSTDLTDPLVAQSYSQTPDMAARLARFLSGDVGALSAPGVVVLTFDATSSNAVYR